jgi:hypothetical protein
MAIYNVVVVTSSHQNRDNMKKILVLAIFLFASLLPAQKPSTTSVVESYIVAGSTTQVTDSRGIVWSPDTGLYNLGTPASCPITAPPPTNTSDPMLYKAARVGSATAGPMVYTFYGLATGAYQVTLYFDECYWTAVGKRMFNIQINNATVFTNVDIFAAVGKNAAYTLTSTANVTTGTMTITFITIPGSDIPLVNAIKLVHPHSATLKWNDGVNPAGTVAYNIYRATGQCNTSASFSKIGSLVSGFTYADATIQPQTSYCYQITAQSIISGNNTESLPCTAVYVPGNVSSCNCQ